MCLAVPGRVTETYDVDAVPMGRVDFGGVEKEICLAYVPDVVPGDYAIVHVGFAIAKLDEASAREVLAELASLGPVDD